MKEVIGKQIPNLQEMDEREARRFLAGLLANLDPEEEYSVRHPADFSMELPQSGERFRGRENVRSFQEAYRLPTRPQVEIRRVLVKEALWVVEGTIGYDDGRTFALVMICELRDGKMWRDRWYFAEPFEASKWRSQWVERMEQGAPLG